MAGSYKVSKDLKCSLLCLYLVGLFFFTMAQVVEDEDHEAHCPVCSVEENKHCFTSDVDKSCTEGNYRREQCDNSESCCDFCEENTYQPKFNNCKCCILCTNCTELGREELQSCNITHDAKCGNTSASVAPVEEGVTTGSGKEDASDLPPQHTCPEISSFGSCYNVALLVFLASFTIASLFWICLSKYAQICHDWIKNNLG
ncbi:uncharacterized protein [Apostichopus japonicus]|uniref:uncharacterized protein isoform X2 n=1 Tax=Stichopus japonicus TaxID=307972 RepID=UPI003AB39DE6